MKTPKFITSIKGSACNAAFKLKKHSPEILFVLGVAGVVVGTVKACKATTKLSATLNAHKEELDAIHTASEEGVIATLDKNGVAIDEEYTEKDAKKDTTIVYTKMGLDVVKIYAPAVIITTLSIAALTTSHVILKSRNLSIATAYAALDKSYKDYRQRVKDRFGPEIERELRYNIQTKAIERTETDEKGKERKVVECVKSFEGIADGDYSKIFDECNPNWQRDATFNREWLEIQQVNANKKLETQGYLFLNDVLEALGYEPTKAGQVVGWLYNKHNKDYQDIVDFGMYQLDSAHQSFLDGFEKSVLLDFNVRGIIINDVDLED